MVGLILWWTGLELAVGEVLSGGLLELLAKTQLEGLVGGGEWLGPQSSAWGLGEITPTP